MLFMQLSESKTPFCPKRLGDRDMMLTDVCVVFVLLSLGFELSHNVNE